MDALRNDSQPDWQEIEEYWLRYAGLATLGQLASAIMHDTRNALTILSGNLQILLMKGAKVEMSEVLDRIEKSLHQVERIESQINRAESFSRRARGTIENIAPNSVVENALFFVEHRINGLPRKVIANLRPSKKRLSCDIGLLEFAIGELIQLCLAAPIEGDLLVSAGEHGRNWECRIEQDATPEDELSSISRHAGLLIATRAIVRMGGKIKCLHEQNHIV